MAENEPEKAPEPTRFKRILRLLSEAVDEAGIRDVAEYPHTPSYYRRHWALNEKDWKKSFAVRRESLNDNTIDLYRWDTGDDIILVIQLSNSRFVTWHEVSLLTFADLLFIAAEMELEKPELHKILDVNSAQEREEAIDRVVKTVLRRLFWALPQMYFQATNRALHDSIVSYIKTDMENMLSLHWRKLELPRNYEYLPTEILEILNRTDKVIEDWRQRFIGNKREIPESELAKLPDKYKQLSKAYREAKKEHNQKKTKFLAASNRNTTTGWNEQWKKEFVYYPDLYPDCLMLIVEDDTLMPRQIAYQHLSFDWGYSPDHMRRIIDQQKALMRGRKEKVTHERNK